MGYYLPVMNPSRTRNCPLRYSLVDALRATVEWWSEVFEKIEVIEVLQNLNNLNILTMQFDKFSYGMFHARCAVNHPFVQTL